MATYLISTGLILDIVGVWMLYMYGLPERLEREGAGYLRLEGDDPAEKEKAARYDCYSRWAIAALILGFALQILGNHI